MAGYRWAAALPALLAVTASGSGSGHHHQLSRNADAVRTFDNTALGNLANGLELANLEVPRRHLFTARIGVGTPPQPLKCLLDIGSADLFVPSKRCKDCGEVHHFAADKSSTFMPAVIKTPQGMMPLPVRASVDGGDIEGFLVQDSIAVPGIPSWHNQSFIIVEDERLPQDRDWDGLCGLGFRELSDGGSPLYRNMPSGQQAIFSLIPNRQQGHMTTFLSVGEMPTFNILTETLAWAAAEPMRQDEKLAFWIVSGGLKVNGGASKSSRFLLDTSTAYILAPRKHFRSFVHELFPSQAEFESACGMDRSAGNLVVCDCHAAVDGGRAHQAFFSILLSGKEFRIPAQQLFKRVPSADGGEMCLLLVQQSPDVELVVMDPLAMLAGLLGSSGEPPHGDGDKASSIPPLPPFLLPDDPAKHHVVQSHESRRLEDQFPTFTLGGPRAEDDPMRDVWVLGGVFFEHFAAILDFENKRLGLAVPSDEPMIGALPIMPILQTQAPAPTSQSDGGGGGMGGGLFLVVILGLAAGGGYVYKQTTQRKNLVAPTASMNEDFEAQDFEAQDELALAE